MTRLFSKRRIGAFVVSAGVLLASSGVINVISRNQVSHEIINNQPVTAYRFEPSTAAGGTWVSSWAAYPVSNPSAVTSYVGAWNGSSWQQPSVPLTPPNAAQTWDVNLSWDSTRSRFVFALLDSIGNIWYGYSTSASGTQWVFGNQNGSGVAQPVFPFARWDYPSIGVDSSGRVIVGAVNLTFSPSDTYSVAVSSDGQHFAAPNQVPITSGTSPNSRVIAAGTTFHLFVPALNDQNLAIAIYRYQSSDGVNWSGPNLIMTFGAPLNSAQPSGSNLPIFYAPYLSAAGYTDGRWIVGWQENVNGWNNVEICTSDRGCGAVNQQADDEFLAGVSASSDGYWVAYHAYTSLNSRALPLITQAIYFPTGSSPVGATTNTNIWPTSWIVAGQGQPLPPRCTQNCYAAGDFNTPSSNPYASSHTTFVGASSLQTDLFDSFQLDPQATANVPNFVPNFVPHKPGTDLSSLGIPVPAASAALPPQARVSMKP
jgi:hypothetical protein